MAQEWKPALLNKQRVIMKIVQAWQQVSLLLKKVIQLCKLIVKINKLNKVIKKIKVIFKIYNKNKERYKQTQ